MAALRFPEHFPPTDRWKKFFAGVRWLGPDLSFFNELKMQQGWRASTEMEGWGGGERQRLAGAISKVLAAQLDWESNVFLPQDSFAVAFRGPSFDCNDVDIALEAVVELLIRDFGLSVPQAFWSKQGEASFAEVVDGLLVHRHA